MPSRLGGLRMIAALIGLSSTAALARSCYKPEGEENFEVNSPEDVSRLFEGCESIWGDIVIGDNYTGPFVLPGVVQILGELDLNWGGWYEERPDYSIAPNVTSIELPDLEMMYSADIRDVPTLRLVSMPKLTEVWHGLKLLQQRNPPCATDFRSLRWANDLSIKGRFTRMNFDSLETVSNILEIASNLKTAISLPRLNLTCGLRLWGVPSSVSLPSFSHAQRITDHSCSHGHVSMGFDAPISVDLPKLRLIEFDFSIAGNITSLSLPYVHRLENSFSVSSTQALRFSVPLERAFTIQLGGHVQAASFPNLKYVHRVSAVLEGEFDCSGLSKQVHGIWSKTDVDPRSFEFFCKAQKVSLEWLRAGGAGGGDVGYSH
ncbi:hypothetical protein BJX64DRAFT_288632 [Aspergillus heterothallicus]